MPIKYIGKKTTFKGKSLWEIVGNLKNYGVNRIVIRSQYQRYPEACYMKILKVAALPNTITNPHESRKVVALVQRTFRGKTFNNPVQIDSVSYKGDYVLVPKDQEAHYLNATAQPAIRVLPRTMEFPPLMKEIIIRQAKQEGNPLADTPKLQLRYNLSGVKYYRIAEENETPTVNIEPIRRQSLYPNVKHERH